jgi:hypothetical protein
VSAVVLIGAGKFALEVARYVEEAGHRVECHLAVAGEPVHVPADRCVPLEGFDPAAGCRIVLALSDVDRRREVIDDVVTARGLLAENIIHPAAQVDASAVAGVGNIVGPNCYVGVNVEIGSFNVVNYHCSIGHHSRIGSNNFVAPNFHCGNSVRIGDGNFFGVSCTLAPELTVGDDNRFQAGLTLFDDVGSGLTHLAPNRVKSIKSS